MSDWNNSTPATPPAGAGQPTVDAPAKPADGTTPAPTGRLSKNITLSQFSMYAPSVKNPDKQLRLNIGISATGFPFMNVDADENIQERTKENNFGKLTARLGGTVFYTLLNMLKFAKTKEAGWKMGLQNFHNYVNGQKVDKPQHTNDVLVGVDNDGCVWMTIVENGRESVRFFFGPSDWHNWKKGDGEMASRKEMNHWSLEGYVSGVTAAMSAIMGLHAVNGTGEEKFGSGAPSAGGNSGWKSNGGNNNWKDRQGNGGGGWKGGNNNGGGWQKKPWQNNGQGGGGGGWKNNNNGGGGGWQNRNGGGNGGGWNKGGNNGGGWNKGGNNFGNNGGRVETSNEVADFGDIEV